MKPDIEYVYNKLKQLRFDFKESDRKLFPNEYTFDYSLDRYVRVDGNDLYISKDTFKPLEEELEYAEKFHNLEEEIGCPLDVRLGVSLGTPVYIFVQVDKSRQPDIDIRRGDGTWQKVIEDRLLTKVIVNSYEGLGNIKCPSFQVSAPDVSEPFEKFERHERRLLWKDYKVTWWLKKDRSE